MARGGSRQKWTARPCCCSSHREMAWAAAVQYLLDSPRHVVYGKTRGKQIPGDFYFDRRLEFRIHNSVLEYRCALWERGEWGPYVRKPNCGRGQDYKTFVPVNHVCSCATCDDGEEDKGLRERVEQVRRQIEQIKEMLG